ncbi:MAG TPA: ImmA/IrrE family metallo-endopeptidase [Verrucomicrobiota bacterium]|jgi:Zn-dependent peptidase ImmA (M78 family)|nr:ImmA/IrrE family metallo-endopeptidase [Verrucomicrobiota bacterium]
MNLPELNSEDISIRVKEFVSGLKSYKVPVDIEGIIESQNIEIVPVPFLKKKFGVESGTNSKFDKIFVDRSRYRSERYYVYVRYAMAYELGHIVMHQGILNSKNSYKTTEEWVRFMRRDEDWEYWILKYQANVFARALLIPEEPLFKATEELEDDAEFAALFGVTAVMFRRRLSDNDRVLDEVNRIVEKRDNEDNDRLGTIISSYFKLN